MENYFFTGFYNGMLNFKSKCETIQNADRIARTAKSIYPHISGTKSGVSINRQIGRPIDLNLGCNLSKLETQFYERIENLRKGDGVGISLYRSIINRLKSNHIGNCYEEAFLCEMIGKINGIKNISPAKIFFNRNSSGAQMPLSHVVTVLSEQPLCKDVMYQFKNKEAVIIDSWLGITAFAEEYFTKLRNDFSGIFTLLPNDELIVKKLKSITRTPSEYHRAKAECFKPNFFLKVHDEAGLSDADAEILKEEFPELIMKKRQ